MTFRLSEENRIAELDGLRSAAVLGVVAWHYIGLSQPAGSAVFSVLALGRTGVDLFFVLSGYLIGRILLLMNRDPSFFSAFYGRRAFRILPLYFIMIGIHLVGQHLDGPLSVLFAGDIPAWAYALGLQNFWMAAEQTYGARWLAVTWSLAVEEQFYLIFPLVVYFARRSTVLRLCLALLIICPIARIATWALGDGLGCYVLTPMRADVIAMGVIVACLQQSAEMVPYRRLAAVTFIAALCLLPLFTFDSGSIDSKMALWGHSYLVALFGSMVFLVVNAHGSGRLGFLRRPIAGFFARISYALYLVHQAVAGVLLVFFANGPVLIMVAFAVSIGICVVSARFLERPLIMFARQRFQPASGKHAEADGSMREKTSCAPRLFPLFRNSHKPLSELLGNYNVK
jgi:peptidoglycan/LPS O-acetylase OafA/YrhL